MADNNDQCLTKKEKYAEVGVNYRYFLNWRHALLAGYLIALYSFAQAFFHDIDHGIVRIIYLGVILVTALIWCLEYRVRSLYRACIKAGKDLEKPNGGVFTKLDDENLINEIITHSNALDVFFLIILLGMIILSSVAAIKNSDVSKYIYFCGLTLDIIGAISLLIITLNQRSFLKDQNKLKKVEDNNKENKGTINYKDWPFFLTVLLIIGFCLQFISIFIN